MLNVGAPFRVGDRDKTATCTVRLRGEIRVTDSGREVVAAGLGWATAGVWLARTSRHNTALRCVENTARRNFVIRRAWRH